MTQSNTPSRNAAAARTSPAVQWQSSNESRAQVALLEIAANEGLTGLREPTALHTAIMTRQCERLSQINQLQGEADVLRRHRIPKLERDVRDMQAARDAWVLRARAAERHVAVGMGVIVLLAMGFVVAIALCITRTL